MYGRGMPRPIAEVTSTAKEEKRSMAEVTSTAEEEWHTNGSRHAATVQHLRFHSRNAFNREKRMAYYWVAACRDRTTPSIP